MVKGKAKPACCTFKGLRILYVMSCTNYVGVKMAKKIEGFQVPTLTDPRLQGLLQSALNHDRVAKGLLGLAIERSPRPIIRIEAQMARSFVILVENCRADLNDTLSTLARRAVKGDRGALRQLRMHAKNSPDQVSRDLAQAAIDYREALLRRKTVLGK